MTVPVATSADSGAIFRSEKTVEHYTPMDLINHILAFWEVSEFDLDPCADPQKRLPARFHYTKADNGLMLPWMGTVFINPPYGRKGNISAWVRKFCEEPLHDYDSEFIMLCKVATGTGWYQHLWQFPKCYIKGRLRFVAEDYSRQETAQFDSVLVYRGRHVRAFFHHFKAIGHCE